jgi:hypothetical protein
MSQTDSCLFVEIFSKATHYFTAPCFRLVCKTSVTGNILQDLALVGHCVLGMLISSCPLFHLLMRRIPIRGEARIVPASPGQPPSLCVGPEFCRLSYFCAHLLCTLLLPLNPVFRSQHHGDLREPEWCQCGHRKVSIHHYLKTQHSRVRLFNNPLLSDITIRQTCNGVTKMYHAHRPILASHSDWFMRAFTGNFKVPDLFWKPALGIS